LTLFSRAANTMLELLSVVNRLIVSTLWPTLLVVLAVVVPTFVPFLDMFSENGLAIPAKSTTSLQKGLKLSRGRCNSDQ